MSHSPTVLELAEEYFPHRVVSKSSNTYQIAGPHMDSVVIFDDTNTYCRFSNRRVGGPREFAHFIVGLSRDEVEELCGDESDSERSGFISAVKRRKSRAAYATDTGLSLQDVVGERSYSRYMGQRMVSEETAARFRLECDNDDVVIPLTDVNGRRIGSQVRYAHAKSKGDRYRAHMVGSHDKPCAWPLSSLRNHRSVVVLVEGAWGVMRLEQVAGGEYDITPLATLGTYLSDELEAYLLGCNVVALIDDDEGGKHVKSQLVGWVKRGMRVEVYTPTFNGRSVYVDDINDEQVLTLLEKIRKVSRFKL